MKEKPAVEKTTECFVSYYEIGCQSAYQQTCKWILRCRCRLGDLLENEIEFIEQKFKNCPDFILSSPAYTLHKGIALNTVEERHEHRQALEAFDRDVHAYDKHAASTQVMALMHVRIMRDLQSLADKIRADRPETPPIDTETSHTDTVTNDADPATSKSAVEKGQREKILSPPKTKIGWEKILEGVYVKFPETEILNSTQLRKFLKDWAKRRGVEIEISDSRLRQLEPWKKRVAIRESGRTRYGYNSDDIAVTHDPDPED